MKSKYLLILSFFSTFTLAQQSISFESSEAYTLGSINGQNNWEVTLNNDELPIQNQVISNEIASAGTQSLKIDVDINEDFGWLPIFGAAKAFDRAYDFKNTTVEFDVYITELDGSTFEFGTFGIADTDEFMPVAIYSFNYTGNLEVVKNPDYGYENANFTWEANRWYKLKSVVSQNDIKFYIDGNLIYTLPNFSQTNITGVNFVHDNFKGSAYIDNIKINDEVLAVSDINKANIKLYPNPVRDLLKINVPDNQNISEINVYNIAGQKLRTFTSQKEINVESLSKGTYIINIRTGKNTRYDSKFIKQ
ncbi:T9SS type A sorting domain-containing protein [Epilithonimonas mollis]|uniref:Por secretion system C-terminal sorting domain-containing protein n=1 Tax=Epilithonimonas mollis TaxID=216903 RepID=A0A1M6TWF9_9FLAO|nr:T9SS type A sorting domain-containing protein [Epilithonimonas mollis]SHK61266.1 Por secretion system C-terminal sorting domain-containing protein [Epilithonimonas mollis]